MKEIKNKQARPLRCRCGREVVAGREGEAMIVCIWCRKAPWACRCEKVEEKP